MRDELNLAPSDHVGVKQWNRRVGPDLFIIGSESTDAVCITHARGIKLAPPLGPCIVTSKDLEQNYVDQPPPENLP